MMTLLKTSPDVQRALVALLQPAEVCLLSSTCSALAAACQQTRRAILLSRHKMKTQLRHVRKALEQRQQFLQHECKLQLPLLDAEIAQGLIIEQLQHSPNGIRDLAAAVQAASAAVTHQTSTAPCVLKAVKDDLVRLVTLTCLLAWRQRKRSSRTVQQHAPQRAQQTAHEAAAEVLNAWDAADNAAEDDDNVQVVLLQPEVPAQQHQQLVAASAETGSQAGAGHWQLQVQAQQQQQQHAAPAHHMPPLRQHHAVPGAVQLVSVSVQTDLSPSMVDVAELVSGLQALMSCPSTKPCRATLNLLAHHIQKQQQAWNLPGAGAAAGVPQQAHAEAAQ